MDSASGETASIEESIENKDDIKLSEKENNVQINTNNDIDMPLLENQEEAPGIEPSNAETNSSQEESIITLSSDAEPQVQEELSSVLSSTSEIELHLESSNTTTEIDSLEESIVEPSSEKTDLQQESVMMTPNIETDLQEKSDDAVLSDLEVIPNEESEKVINNSDESLELKKEIEKQQVLMDSIENNDNVALEITETIENSENSTAETSTELEETVYTITGVVEEIPVKTSVSGQYEQFIDQANTMEEENAIADILSADVETEAVKMETQIVLENADVANISDETNKEEITAIQYHVVINEEEAGVSVNGLDQLDKSNEEISETIDSEAMNNIVTITTESSVQNAVDTVITLPSETVTEVTLTDLEVLETNDGLVTINELDNQSEQVVILPSDQVVLMETDENYEQMDSLDDDSFIEDAEENMSEEKKVPKKELQEQLDDTKPSVKIPCHVLGRSVDNPLVDPVRNGRMLLKPRLGVKIPYRNLTSQIVSKQEIAEEIMERSRLRQSVVEPPAGGDVFFAKKLTQRLAKKIVPTTKSSKTTTKTTSTSSSSSSKKVITTETSKEIPKVATTSKPPVPSKELQEPSQKSNSDSSLKTPLSTSDKIIDNSDLIALLEGDDVPDWNIGKNEPLILPSQNKPEKQSSDWEKEIALKQLRNLPKQTKGIKHSFKQIPVLQTSTNNKEPIKQPAKEPAKEPTKGPTKEPQIEVKQSKEIPQKNDIDEKDDLSMQPRFSSNTPLKTYTRKRKPIDFKPSSSSSLTALSPPKKPAIEDKTVVQSSKKSTVSNEEKSIVQLPKKTVSNEEKSIVQSSKKLPVSSEEKSVTQSTKRSAEEKSVSQPTKKSISSNEKSPQQKQVSPNSAQKTSSPAVQKSTSVQKSSSVSVQQKSSSVQKQPSTPIQKSSAVVQDEKSSPVAQKSSIDNKLPVGSKTTTDKKSSTVQKISVDQKSTPVVQKLKKPEEPSTPKVEIPTPVNQAKKPLSPNTYISKSSRIVKRKKIWDPDEVTPSAKLIKSPKLMESAKSSEKSVISEKKLNKSNNNEKMMQKSDSPAAKPKLINKLPAAILKPNNEKATPKKIIVKKTIIKKKKPKRLTEVDRLLMDEGAVNLLYSVKNTEELQNVRRNKKKKTLISIDKAQRELMNKTNEIKNDLQINSTKDSPISLRKKEGATPKASPGKDVAATVLHRKKSKDSVSGSVHSPPASPGFTYSQHAEASRIIRRHSSSSFSSENTDDEFVSDKTNEKKQKPEFQRKKSKINHEKQGKALTIADKQVLSEEMSKNFNKAVTDDPKYSQFETFNVKKIDNLVQIILAPTSPNGQMTLSEQVLQELAELLNILDKDKTCRVVVISSSGSSFCQGLDYKELVSDDETTRQKLAEKYAASIRDLLTALTNFSKILVAGVHGNTIGLGVTMLPLFDMVLASDTATFSAPYARLGCAAEGGALLTLSHVMHNALASELFFASRKLTAAEALRLGLVTRTLWPDKFQEELISALMAIASQSLQSMQAIKKQLRRQLLLNVEESLKSEASVLIEHWTSNECQSNFNSYSLEIK